MGRIAVLWAASPYYGPGCSQTAARGDVVILLVGYICNNSVQVRPSDMRSCQFVGHERIFKGPRPGVIEIEYVLRVEPFNRKRW